MTLRELMLLNTKTIEIAFNSFKIFYAFIYLFLSSFIILFIKVFT